MDKENMLTKLAAASALLVTPLVLAAAAPAHADDASYLDAAGPMPGPIAPAGIIQMGHMICDQLHIDPSADNLGARVFGRAVWMHGYVTPQAVDAAQRELCPDTLGAQP